MILDGIAEFVTDAAHPLASKSTEAVRAKYPQYFSSEENAPFRPFWMLRPTTVYAWSLSGFPGNMTRWRMD